MRTLAEINKQIEQTKSDIAMLAAMGGDADISIPLEDLEKLYVERNEAEKAEAEKHMSTHDYLVSMLDYMTDDAKE